MIGPGDIAAVVQAVGFGIAEYQRERTGKLLHDWAGLMMEPDSPERAITIRQFAQDRTQERGFTPWYDGTESVPIPKDLLTDIMDLLIDPTEPMLNTSVRFLDRARRAFGFAGVAEKARRDWSERIQSRHTADILEMLEVQTARRGRARAYSASLVIDMELDWVADVGMFLING